MSDREDLYEMHRDDTRYSTPVPELDDHRHQIASVQRPQRSRRGTIDTLYGAQLDAQPALNWVDEALRRTDAVELEMESAIDDEDEDGNVSPMNCRRPRGMTQESRAMSPPNSVKAFAEARRRELRDHSPEPTPMQRKSVCDNICDNHSMHRTISRQSKHSQRSRRYTNNTLNDAQSIASSSVHSSAAEDVCFPQSTTDLTRDKRKLYIDFDFLERFIAEEERDHTPPKNQPHHECSRT